MGWLYVLGLVLLAAVVVGLMSVSGRDEPAADDEPDDAPRDYQWGDELAEFSYRHPWDDEI